MDAHAYLGQLNKLDRHVQNTRAEIERWQEVATSCTVEMDGERVQSSGPGRRIENAVVTYIDLQKRLEEQISEAEKKRREIINTLYENLPTDEYDVLYHVYVQGMMLKQVEAEMHRSRSWVSRTHRAAIKSLQRYLDSQEKLHDKQICISEKTKP